MDDIDLLFAFSKINITQIEKADHIYDVCLDFKHHKAKKMRAVGSFVVCLVVAAVSIGVLMQNQTFYQTILPAGSDIQTESSVSETNEPALCIIPDWKDRAVYDQFYSINYNGKKYTAIASTLTISPATQSVDTVLFSTEATAEDPNTGIIHTIDLTVYKFSNINPDCIVGVQFEGYEEIFAYSSYEYQPQNLGEMLNAIDFFCTSQIGNVYYNGNCYTVDMETVYESLLSDRSLVSVGNVFYTPIVEVVVNFPTLGKYNCGFVLTAEGYMEANILNGKAGTSCFYIGKENIAAFISKLYRYGEG